MRPRCRSTSNWQRSLSVEMTSRQRVSPIRSAVAVELTTSVNRMDARIRSPASIARANARIPAKSYVFHESSPITHPSCPAGISNTVPGPTSNVVPSSIRFPRRPDAYPEVVVLARARARDRLDVLRPVPAGVEQRPTDDHGVQFIDLHPTIREVRTSSGDPIAFACSLAIVGLSLTGIAMDAHR